LTPVTALIKRINALNYTMIHDDGQHVCRGLRARRRAPAARSFGHVQVGSSSDSGAIIGECSAEILWICWETTCGLESQLDEDQVPALPLGLAQRMPNLRAFVAGRPKRRAPASHRGPPQLAAEISCPAARRVEGIHVDMDDLCAGGSNSLASPRSPASPGDGWRRPRRLASRE